MRRQRLHYGQSAPMHFCLHQSVYLYPHSPDSSAKLGRGKWGDRVFMRLILLHSFVRGEMDRENLSFLEV